MAYQTVLDKVAAWRILKKQLRFLGKISRMYVWTFKICFLDLHLDKFWKNYCHFLKVKINLIYVCGFKCCFIVLQLDKFIAISRKNKSNICMYDTSNVAF